MRDLYLERSARDPVLYAPDPEPSFSEQWNRQATLVVNAGARARHDAVVELDSAPKCDSDGASLTLIIWTPSLEALGDVFEALAKRCRELAEPKIDIYRR